MHFAHHDFVQLTVVLFWSEILTNLTDLTTHHSPPSWTTNNVLLLGGLKLPFHSSVNLVCYHVFSFIFACSKNKEQERLKKLASQQYQDFRDKQTR